MERAWVGFSGGPDSTALLMLASKHLAPAWSVSAAHVNHGLQRESREWVVHCREVCARLAVPLEVLPVKVEADASGVEGAARDARYRALAQLLEPGDALLTAHHRDDQVETFLIQAMRGCGVDGLAAMPSARPLGRGIHLRPLLAFGRDELRNLLKQSGLPAVQDPMNQDSRRERGFIREELMPLLESRRPGVAESMARTVRLCAAASRIIADVASEGLVDVVGPDPAVLHLEALRQKPDTLHAELIRAWLRKLALPLPRERQLQALLAQIEAREDATVTVTWPGVEIRRYRDRLVAGPPLRLPPPDMRIDWASPRLSLPEGIGELRWEWTGAAPQTWPQLQVRFRTGGERIRPRGHDCSRSLKKLFQDAGVPPWERKRTPLLFLGDELVAVGDLWWTDEFHALQADLGIHMVFRRRSS